MSKEYDPKNVALSIGGVKIEGFSEGSCIQINPTNEDKKTLSNTDKTRTITLSLADEFAKKIQDAIDNAEFVIGYDNERLCPICEGQNDYDVLDSVNGHPCEIETYCTECGHKDYWVYRWYEPKDEKGEFI